MIVSDARRAANRRNSLKSTGPKSAEGKEVVRRNALKHGLTSSVLRVEAADAVQERALGLYQTLRPQNAWQAWVGEEIAVLSVRLDRLAWIERRVRDGACWRAMAFWDDDQRQEADRVGARLAKDPAKVVGQLRRSAPGCDWLIERWAILAHAADQQSWTDDQTKLAYDLLGTPSEARGDAPGLTIDAEGRALGPPRPAAELARELIAGLQTQRDRVVEADEIARALATADLDDLNNRDLVRLRRYEREIRRHLRWFFELSTYESPHAAANPDCRPVLARIVARFASIPGGSEPPTPPVVEPAPGPRSRPEPLAPPAPPAAIEIKAIAPAVAPERRPVRPAGAPRKRDETPATPARTTAPRPVTAYEQWAWEKGEADRDLWIQVQAAKTPSAISQVSAGRR